MNNINSLSKINQKEKWTYVIFAFTLFIYLFIFTLKSSTYSFYYPNLPVSKVYLLSIAIITILGIITMRNFSSLELVFFMFAYIIAFLSYYLSHSFLGLMCVSIAFFAKDKNTKKILQIYFILILFNLLFVIFSYFIHVIPQISYTREGSVNRNSWGCLHPNTLSLYILALNVVFYFIKSLGRLAWKDLWLVLFSTFITLYYSKSYTTSIILLIILFSIFISINSKPVMYAEFELFKKYSFLKYLTFFFIFVLLISYIFFVWKNPTNNVVSALGSTISSRLLMGNEGLHWYGISLFGQPVNFVDSSYIVLNRAYSYSTYFTVDSLYIKLLINEGLFVGFIFLFFIFRALMKSIESNKLIFLIILSLLIYSIFETGLSSPILSYVVAYAFSDGYVKIKATKGGKNK